MNSENTTIPYDGGLLVDTPRGKALRMLSYEEVPGLRCQQYLWEAENQRLARRLSAGRWWRRLSRYAAYRAERATR